MRTLRPLTRTATFISAALLVGTLAACGTQGPVNNTYPSSQSQAPVYNAPANFQEYGRITNIEVFQTQAPASNGVAGTVIGGVLGGVLGNQVGGGSGRDAATVVGAVGGAIAGNQIQKNRNPEVRESVRVSVRLDNGAYRAYDMTTAGDLRIGDRVRIDNGQIFRS
ncbi:MAG: glycine zipper 2TM domain-containing protein [Pseudomonadota bacterium]